MELGRVPWYDDDTGGIRNPDKESTSEDEAVAEQQKNKKRRGRKPKVIHDETYESAVTTNAGAQINVGLNRMQINERLGIVEPVTSTSGLTARGTPTATYLTAPGPTIAIFTASDAIASVTTPRPVTAVAQRRETNPLQELPHCTSISPELQNYWTEKARHWKMSTLSR